MIKVEVIEEFTLKDFDKIENLVRAGSEDEKGRLYKNDTFECTKDMVEYLSGKNTLNKTVVKVIEVTPEENVKPLDEKNIEKVAKEIKKAVKTKNRRK